MNYHRRFAASVAIVAAAFAAPCFTWAAGAPGYHATPIPGIPELGFNLVFPDDINESGVVVGHLQRGVGLLPVRSFIWSGKGPVQDLGDLGVWQYVQAVAINNNNQVVGTAMVLAEPGAVRPEVLRGFVWESGAMVELPPLPGDSWSYGIAINELGEALVRSSDGVNDARDRYYIWRAGLSDPIGRLAFPGGPAGGAWSMNSSRQIVGSATNRDGQDRAFLWDGGRMIDLGLAPGDDFFSAAYKIDDSGSIVGESSRFDDAGGHGATSRAVVWRGATLVRVIDPLPGDYVLQGLGVNAAGRVVGMSGWPQRAFVADEGPAIDLNEITVGPSPAPLYQARDINNRGQVIVDGFIGCCGFLLDPQPTP